jgi:tRNA modification GTPase
VSTRDTIAAIATAPGRAGIGVVRVSGWMLTALTQAITGKPLLPRVATVAQFKDADGNAIDEGLAIYFAAPASFTGEDVLELQGHGGPVVLARVLQRCLELGARMAAPGEFTQRAFLNGKLDLAQAEAVADLIDASTEQAARCAMRSLDGHFSQYIQLVDRKILGLRALTEATLDFPEEEIDAPTRNHQVQRLDAIVEELSKLLLASSQGSLLREGAHVVLAGRPNAGKSSLLNQLAGEDVAIVAEIPGTTRDAVRQTINLAGMPVHIVDTAGLRDSTDPVERAGIERTWAAIDKADLVLLVIDATKGETAEDKDIIARLPQRLRQLRVFNKVDLVGKAAASDSVGIWLSAKSGEGMELLRLALADALGWQKETEGVFMARARHLEAMRGTLAGLERAKTVIARQELFAEELRRAHESLMSITGQQTADDVLGEIFSRFCIGK